MTVMRLGEHIPVVDATAFVHSAAVLIGDVIVGPGCFVGPCAVLRGDFGRIVLEAGANLQDTCVMHSFPGKDCLVERDGHIGHGAVLHGCRVGRNALVGMNSVVMDDAVISEECLVAACSFVPARFACQPRQLVAGCPASVRRALRDEEVAWKSAGTAEYQQLARRYLAEAEEVEPLARVQADRPRAAAGDHRPKPDTKAGGQP